MKRHDFCSLRIYLTMKQTRTGASVWQKLVGRSLGSYLVQEALRAGLPFASVWDGALGYGEGAQAIAARLPEHGPMDNPACVELLGSREALDRFAHDHEGELEDAIVVIYDGTRFICEGKTSDPRSEHVQNK